MLATAALGGRNGLQAGDRQVVRCLLTPQSLACLLKETASRQRELVKWTGGAEEGGLALWSTPPIPHLARAVKAHLPARSDDTASTPR
jgi:hypothetical protein